MQPPALETALLLLSDAALLQVITAFLHGIADQSDDHLHLWCQSLGFRLQASQEASSSPLSCSSRGATAWRWLAPHPYIVRQRIEHLSQAQRRAIAVQVRESRVTSGSWCQTAVVEQMSTSLKEQGWVLDQGESDLEVLAAFTFLWAGKRIVLKTKTTLFWLLQTLPIGSAFELETTCHQRAVSHGRYCLLLADSTFSTGSATYAWLRRSPQRFEQVVLEPGILALPGRKLIAVLQGDRSQLAFLEPRAYEEQ